MNAIIFNTDECNYFCIANNEYFLLSNVKEKSLHLYNAKCSHRGGPLQLGCLIKKNQHYYVRCPWHQGQTKLKPANITGIKLEYVDSKQARLLYDAAIFCEQDIAMTKRMLFPNYAGQAD